ncbi:MAG: NADH:ubiquinone reductase (Na(+)-transporting) subunit B [Vicingaceae bacterium]
MKFLRKLFDNAHEKLNQSEKTKKYFPLVDAFDTLMFTPNHVTTRGAHIRDAIDLKRTMMFVIIALVPCLLFGMYNVGYQHFLAAGETVGFWDNFLYGLARVLPIVVVSYASGLFIEFIFAIKNGHAVQEGFLVSGMLIPLVMPVEIPLWIVAVATIFAVLIGKEVFGGTGMNVVNIALTARAFIFFAYPTMISGNSVWIDGYTGATPLGNLASFSQEIPAYESLQAFTSDVSLYDAFIGLIPGSIGETSALACLLGAVLLLISGIASFRVMFSFFIGGLAMGYLFNAIADGNEFMMLAPIHQLMLGGFMFGMVFMVTDPVTAAQTPTGKIIYGFIAGALAILIRVANPAYPEGVMLAILFANVMAPLIDHYVVQQNIKRRLNRVKIA